MHLNKHAIALEFDKVLEGLSACAATPLGVDRCLNTPIFWGERERIEREIALSAQARKILDDLGASSFD